MRYYVNHEFRPIIYILLICLGYHALSAQNNPICPPNTPLAHTCSTACVVCDLDGFTNSTQQTFPGQEPPGFCTMIVHSMGWIGFVAGSTNLTISVQVFPCTLGTGIEMGIYATDDCQNFNLVSNCNTDMFQNNTYQFSNTEPLTPGCVYFLVFDNNGPAACPFVVSVLSGSASAPVPQAPASVSGPSKVCPGATATYSVPPVFGACQYTWTAPPGATINGQPSPLVTHGAGGNSVQVTFGQQGGQVCVKGSNTCHTTPTVCKTITVAPIPPTILPPVSICQGESYTWQNGNQYSTNTTLSITYPSWLGCDSTVKQQLNIIPPVITNLGNLYVCEGKCIKVGNGTFCTTGFHDAVLTSAQNCDSILRFILHVVPSHAAAATQDTVTCLKKNALLNGTGSTPNGIYHWYDNAGHLLGSNVLDTVKAPGNYYLTVETSASNITCRDTAKVKVNADTMRIQLHTTADTLSCIHPATIKAASSDTNAVYIWTGAAGFHSTHADTLTQNPGWYFVTAHGKNGCPAYDSVEVHPGAGFPDIATNNGTITCSLQSVMLQVNSHTVGVQFSWTGPGMFAQSGSSLFVSLPGTYTVTALAPNGCSLSGHATVSIDTAAPVISTFGDTLNCIHTTRTIRAISPDSNLSFTWTGPGGPAGLTDTTVVNLPGAYTVVAARPNGCTAQASAVVAIDSIPPSINLTPVPPLTCKDTLQLLQASADSTLLSLIWTDPAGLQYPGNSLPVSVAGMYGIKATGINGCTTLKSTQVIANITPPAFQTQTDTVNCIHTTATIRANTQATDLTITWTGPAGYTATGQQANVTDPGIYTVVATGSNGCTTGQIVSVASDFEHPVISTMADTISCSSPNVAVYAFLQTPVNQVLWSGPGGYSGSGLQIFTATPGIYEAVATGANGCTTAQSIVVQDDLALPLFNLTADSIDCLHPLSSLDVMLQSLVSTLIWSGPGNFAATGSHAVTTLPGNYHLMAIGLNGCLNQKDITVIAHADFPVFNTNAGIISCTNPTALITANPLSPVNQFDWTGPAGFTGTGAQATVAIAGNYTVTATGPNGCTATQSATVTTDLQTPGFGIQTDTIRCNHPLAKLTVNPQTSLTSVSWNGPGGFNATGNQVSVPVTGMYTAVATGPNGCTTSKTVVVSDDLIPPGFLVTGDTIKCNHLTASLDVVPQTSLINVSWSGPAGFNSAGMHTTTGIAGTYIAIASGSNGCTASHAVQIAADMLPPVFSLQTDTIRCNHSVANLVASSQTPNVTFSWSGPANYVAAGAMVTTGNPGTYQAEAIGPNGCKHQLTTVVETDLQGPVFGLHTDTIRCNHLAATLSATAQTTVTQFSWSGPAGFTATGSMVTVSNAGTYQVIASAPNGCTTQKSIVVPADLQPPQFTIHADTIDCNHPQGTLSAMSQTVITSFMWSDGAGFMVTGATVSAGNAGIYTVLATGMNGCTAEKSITLVAQTQPPVFTTTTDTITCAHPVARLKASAQTASITYTWTGSNGFTGKGSPVFVTNPGTYQVVAKGLNGCTAVLQVVVGVNFSTPVFSTTADTIDCLHHTAAMTAIPQTTGVGFAWTGPGQFTATGPKVTAGQPGTYHVVATGLNGCTSGKTVVLPSDLTPPLISISVTPLGCRDSIARLTAVTPAGATLVWEGPQGMVGTESQEIIGMSGFYTLTVTAINGCTATSGKTVIQPKPTWHLDVGPDQEVVDGSNVMVQLQTDLPADQILHTEWIPGPLCNLCLVHPYTVYDTMQVWIRVEDIKGCIQSDSLRFTTYKGGIYVPNIFSPDGNGINDEFRIYTTADVSRVLALQVYDRWGSLVFSRHDFLPDDPAGFWDGQYNDKPLGPAVFVWELRVAYNNGTIRELHGDVTLMR
jgi:gliding motility-associated-like protein